MRKKRHNYTPEEKVSILRRHLVELRFSFNPIHSLA
jgi:hypothetical protein